MLKEFIFFELRTISIFRLNNVQISAFQFVEAYEISTCLLFVHKFVNNSEGLLVTIII